MSDAFWGSFFGCLPILLGLYLKHLNDMWRLAQQTKTLVAKTDETKRLVVEQTAETKQVALASNEAAIVGIEEAKKAYVEANYLNRKLLEVGEKLLDLRRDFQTAMRAYEDNIAANARHTLANKANVEVIQAILKERFKYDPSKEKP